MSACFIATSADLCRLGTHRGTQVGGAGARLQGRHYVHSRSIVTAPAWSPCSLAAQTADHAVASVYNVPTTTHE